MRDSANGSVSFLSSFPGSLSWSLVFCCDCDGVTGEPNEDVVSNFCMEERDVRSPDLEAGAPGNVSLAGELNCELS